MLCECRGPVRDSGWTPFPVCSMQLETSDAPHQGQEALPGEGRPARLPAPGVEARAKSGAIFPPSPQTQRQWDGPAWGAHTALGAEPTETTAHGTHTCHCPGATAGRAAQRRASNTGGESKGSDASGGPQEAGNKQHRKAAVSPDQEPASVEGLNTSTKRQEVGRVG